MISGTAFGIVGVAIVQMILRASDDGGAADAIGDLSVLWDRLKAVRPSPGRSAVSGEQIADELADELPADQSEYRDVPEADWEVASEKVAGKRRWPRPGEPIVP